MKRRLFFGIWTLILLAVEVCIALFAHDRFVRPYVGDVLVVMVLYAAVRVIVPEGCRLLPLLVFLFAAGVELLQLFGAAELPVVRSSTFLRILIGATFDPSDILCYGIGCAILGFIQKFRK